MDYRAVGFKKEIEDLKSEAGPEAIAVAERFHMNMGTGWLWPDFGPRYPDLEIEENPFTIRLEDDLVPMEDEQSFDDSVPPQP
ncbi:hypothetical protein BHE74_00012541 [Ensete ventricosum]|nr:hypothetical protein GW17_00041265 [Ensete ventricosum]RWW79184.1 hypothetical protein BHE74_00012541 [Ensete ventricosum]